MQLRGFTLLPLALAAVACGPKTGGNDAGPNDGGGNNQIIVNVTGTVKYDTSELQWRGLSASWTPPGNCQNGQLADGSDADAGVADGGAGFANNNPPCFAGDTFNVEDAIKALAMLPPLESESNLPASGAFSVPNVNATDTTLALVASVKDPSGLLAFSGYGIGKPPFTSTNTLGCPIYVTSVAFMQHIAAALNSPSNPVSYDDLYMNGVGVVHVVGEDGVTGVAGAQLQHVYGAGSMQTMALVTNDTNAQPPFYIYYLNDDLTGVSTNPYTSSSGMILLENVGSASNFTVTCAAGSTTCSGTFPQVLIGSRVNYVLETIFQQGVTNPTCAGH